MRLLLSALVAVVIATPSGCKSMTKCERLQKKLEDLGITESSAGMEELVTPVMLRCKEGTLSEGFISCMDGLAKDDDRQKVFECISAHKPFDPAP